MLHTKASRTHISTKTEVLRLLLTVLLVRGPMTLEQTANASRIAGAIPTRRYSEVRLDCATHLDKVSSMEFPVNCPVIL